MIEIKNIVKSFSDKRVLNDISTVFETGKTNLTIGRSGSGKTVLMKSMIGLESVDSGQVLFDGKDMLKMTKKERQLLRETIGMVFQNGALFDSMNVARAAARPRSRSTASPRATAILPCAST